MEKVPLRARSTLRFMKAFHFVVHAFLYALIEDGFSVHVETALGQHLGPLKLNGSRDENYLRRFLDEHLKSKGDCKHFKFRVLQLSLRSMGNHYPGYVELLENVKQVRNRLFSLIKGNFCISEADETSMNNHMKSFLEDALEKLNDDSLIRKVDIVNCTDYNLLFDELENWIQEDESYVNDYLSRLRHGKFQKIEYINWIKLSLGISLTRDKLCHFVSEVFHLFLQGNLGGGCISISNEVKNHLKDHSSFHDSCKNCDGSKQFFKRTLNGKRSPNESCEIHTYLINMFVLKKDRKLRDILSCEIKDLQDIICHCSLFQEPNRGVNAFLKEVTKARNEIAHSTNNTMESPTTETYFKNMVGLLCALSQYRIISKPLKSEMKKGERDLEQLSTSKIIVSIFEDNNEALTEKKRALVADIAEANIAEVDHISGLLKDVLREKEHLEKEYQCYANNGATMTSEDGQHLKHLWPTILRFVRIASKICIIRVCTDENLLGPLLELFNQLC